MEYDHSNQVNRYCAESQDDTESPLRAQKKIQRVDLKDKNTVLEELLSRQDIWRGLSSPLNNSHSVSTGHNVLDEQLHNSGWPLSSLIDVAQTSSSINSVSTISSSRLPRAFCSTQNKPDLHCLLFSNAVKDLCKNSAYWALLNPPHSPYAPGLVRHGLPLDRLLIIRPNNKADFIACFSELCRSDAFPVVMAWAPEKNLSYTELRKLHLSCQQSIGLYTLFRSSFSARQASPAGLRLSLELDLKNFYIQIIKQKGSFLKKRIEIPLPKAWQFYTDHKNLGEGSVSHKIKSEEPKIHYLYPFR